MTDVQCPYCNAENEINHDDGYGYSENEYHQDKCYSCKKTFCYETSIVFYYEAHKADCLNGSPHQYEETKTYPKEFAKLRCVVCEDEQPIRK